jgi:hypothetical protein
VQKEKSEIQAEFEQKKEKIQKEKYQLLTENILVKEAVARELLSFPGLAQEEPESNEMQVVKLVEFIQQLQARVMELEIQEVHNQREEVAMNVVERIRELASECKQLSDQSV